MSKAIEELPKSIQEAVDALCEASFQCGVAYGKSNDGVVKINQIIAELSIINLEFKDNCK